MYGKADMVDAKLNVIKGFRYKKSEISFGCLSLTLPSQSPESPVNVPPRPGVLIRQHEGQSVD